MQVVVVWVPLEAAATPEGKVAVASRRFHAICVMTAFAAVIIECFIAVHLLHLSAEAGWWWRQRRCSRTCFWLAKPMSCTSLCCPFSTFALVRTRLAACLVDADGFGVAERTHVPKDITKSPVSAKLLPSSSSTLSLGKVINTSSALSIFSA